MAKPSRAHTRALTALTLGALAAGTLALSPLAAANPAGTGLVISEVYGGGGNSGAPYTHDFVEIFNPTSSTVQLAGTSVAYFSSSGGPGGALDLTGQIPAGKHFLVQMAPGAGNGVALPAPDATGTAAMSASNGRVDLLQGTTLLDRVGYGTANAFEGTAAAPALTNSTSAQRSPSSGTDTDQNRADFVTGAPTPVNSGAADPDPDPEPTGDCGDAATPIHDIQGSGTAFDPAQGGVQTVEAVVSSAMLGGIWVQEEAADADTDPETSEGLFVFLSGQAAPAEGSVVRVTGTVEEFGGKTQLSDVTALLDCGPAATPVEATEVTFPLDAPGDLERYEGMKVQLTDELVISEYFNFDRFGEVLVGLPPGGQDRFYTPTAITEPGAEAQALAADYARRVITIDDRSTRSNPSTLPHPGNGEPFSLTNRFRGGDTITGITGVVDDAFDLYRLQPTEYGDYTSKNPRPESAPAVGGDIQVASFNVLNYFLTLDAGTNQCGPDVDQDCRGANDETERTRQRAKIVAAIGELDADVVGLMEMENTTGVEPAADLVAGLNAVAGAGTYDYVDTGVVGTDAIRLGFLYKPGSVQLAGDFDVLDSSVDPRFDDTKNRPMLTQTFDTVPAAGERSERFTVSVNHLKSKGSSCADVGDPDTGDGQANCAATRTAAAEAIVDHLAGDPTGSNDPDHLIIGDLNSYDHEDPIRALEDGGFIDQVKRFGGERAYGYVFDGQVGYLDHGLANASLSSQVTGTAEWHINSDEPDVLDYDTSFKPAAVDAIYAPDAYRSSDHDPVLVGLDLVSSALAVSVTPTKVVAGKTRPTVHVEVTSPDGSVVDDGLVVVREGDRLLGALTPHDGEVRIPLGTFDEPGEVTLSVTYDGGSAPAGSQDVTFTVQPGK